VEGEDEEGPAHGVNDVLQHLHLVLFVQPTNIGVANLHLGEEGNPLNVPAPVSILRTLRAADVATVLVARKPATGLEISITPRLFPGY
jgi:hypothetical protein